MELLQPLLTFHHGELLNRCEQANHGAVQMNMLLDRRRMLWEQGTPESRAQLRPTDKEFWYHTEAVMAAMASIGNTLWPRQGSKRIKRFDGETAHTVAERADALRAHFGVDDVGLRNVHEVRNALVHMDEKFDEMLAAVPNLSVIHDYIGDPGFHEIKVGDFVYVRTYDPKSRRLSVMGRYVDFQGALNEIWKLWDVLEAAKPRL